jgi:hypothetical protein
MEDEPVAAPVVNAVEEPAPTVSVVSADTLAADAEETLDYFQKLADAS